VKLINAGRNFSIFYFLNNYIRKVSNSLIASDSTTEFGWKRAHQETTLACGKVGQPHRRTWSIRRGIYPQPPPSAPWHTTTPGLSSSHALNSKCVSAFCEGCLARWSCDRKIKRPGQGCHSPPKKKNEIKKRANCSSSSSWWQTYLFDLDGGRVQSLQIWHSLERKKNCEEQVRDCRFFGDDAAAMCYDKLWQLAGRANFSTANCCGN